MNNKLSELSKPVMYVVRTLDGSVASVKVHSYTAPKGFTSAPLYSQEYVSALLQDISTLEQVLWHIHGAALDITVPRAAIAKAAEYATKKENRNG